MELELDLIFQLAVIIISVKVAGSISVKFGQPSVLGKLLVGVLIGPAMLGIVSDSNYIEAFGHIGVIFLMFIAGLETDIKELKKHWYASTVVAIGGIIVPMLGGLLTGIVIGLDLAPSIFLGFLLAATSVSISVQTFRELGTMNQKTSITVLGAAVVDDIIVVVLLAVLMGFLMPSDVSISEVLLDKALFFVIIGVFSWKFAAFMMKLLSKLKVSEPIMSVAIVHCLFYAAIAEYFGVAGIIGAFAAGLTIANTPFKETVEKKLEPIAYTIFVPVFFASIGLKVNLDGFWHDLPFIIGFSLVAIATKIIGAGIGARVTGFNNYDSLIVGAGMVSRGEVALIISTIGLSSGLLSEEYFTAIVVVVLITTLVTPPMLKYLLSRGGTVQIPIKELDPIEYETY